MLKKRKMYFFFLQTIILYMQQREDMPTQEVISIVFIVQK